MVTVFTLIIEIFFLALPRASGTLNVDNFIILFMIVVASAALVFDFVRSKSTTDVWKPLTLGLLFRLFLLFLDIFGKSIYVLPNSGADTEIFYYGSITYMNYGGFARGFFVEMMGTVMRYIGTNRLYLQFLLMLLSIVAILAFVKILDCCGIEGKKKTRAVLIISLLPNFAILSVLYLRESLVAMFLAISVYCFVRWIKGSSNLWFVFAFIFVFFAARFHGGTVGLALGYILVLLLYDTRHGRMQIQLRNIFFSILFSFVFAFLFYNYGDELFGKLLDVDSIKDIANTDDSAGSSYAAYVGNSDNVFNLIIYTPARLFYYLFSPLPWQWRGVSDLIAFFFGALFYIVAVWRAILTLRTQNNHYYAPVKALLIVSIGVVFIFAWGVSSVGTATRHREKMIVLYATLFTLGDSDFQILTKHKRIRSE